MIALLATLIIAANPTLETDKEVYKLGEPVLFTLTNRANANLTWNSISNYPTVWRQLENGKEELARELPAVVLLALGILPPDASKEWEWDQRVYLQKHEEAPDPEALRVQTKPGKYAARFKTFERGTISAETFRISNEPMDVSPRQKLATAWAKLKTGR